MKAILDMAIVFPALHLTPRGQYEYDPERIKSRNMLLQNKLR